MNNWCKLDVYLRYKARSSCRDEVAMGNWSVRREKKLAKIWKAIAKRKHKKNARKKGANPRKIKEKKTNRKTEYTENYH